MKSIIFILILMTTIGITSNSVLAQDYKHPQITQKGEVTDNQGIVLGYVTKEGLIKNAKGKKIGFIDSNGNLTDSKGKKLGKAEKNGNFYNEFGVLEFEVKNNESDFCEMIGRNGQKMGYVHNDYKNQACALHCFAKSKNTKKHKH
jgi:hypothetical protein